MHATGQDGEVRFGYQRAATLTRWTLTEVINRSWRLDGGIKDKNELYLQQTPLTVVLEIATKRWIWEVDRMVVNDTHATFFFNGDPDTKK